MHKNSSSLPVRIRWHLPEVDSIEATVDVLHPLSPTGLPVRSWHVVTEPGADGTPAWSSGRETPSKPLNRRARIRVARHDGPCLLEVRLVDSRGVSVSHTYCFDR